MPATGEREDPFLAFRFQVRMDGDALGGFSEVTGLSAEVEVQEVPEGGVNTFVHKLPGRARFGNLTLRRGLASTAMWEWFAQIVSGDIVRKTVVVELLSPDGGATPVRWVFDSAFPSRWTGPELKAEQSNVAVEAIEICHHGFLVES
ncbi:MAG: phage tail protein [Gemmatimonadetes bacterium]|nr:phage tail protein [Gemmatimonadota bacterium]